MSRSERLSTGKNSDLQGIEYETYTLSRREWVLYGAEGILLAAVLDYVFYRSFFAFILLMPLGFLYPIYKKKDLKKKRLRQLTLQFKEAIQVLSSFLSAGYSLENGLFMSVRELEALYGKDAMITEEFERLAAGVRMNRPVEQLLAEFGERSGIQDVDHFAQVFGMARRSGGELVEIIRQSAGVIRDKIQVQEEIHTMTASRVFEQKIMNGIPFGMILYIDFTSPGFFDIMYGTWMGRLIMTLCLVAVIFVIGTFLGVIAGYFGGIVDGVIMRIADMMISFPGLVLAIAIAGMLGPNLVNAVISIAAVSWTKYARLARSMVLRVKKNLYIEAAVVNGTKTWKILLVHVLPNMVTQMVVTAAADIGTMMLELASLSFLGFGATAPTPEWGLMLNEGRTYMAKAPWLMIYPGIAIVICVVVFNMLGDSIRDVLDPRQE